VKETQAWHETWRANETITFYEPVHECFHKCEASEHSFWQDYVLSLYMLKGRFTTNYANSLTHSNLTKIYHHLSSTKRGHKTWGNMTAFNLKNHGLHPEINKNSLTENGHIGPGIKTVSSYTVLTDYFPGTNKAGEWINGRKSFNNFSREHICRYWEHRT
jgi:hypothetical protein